MRMTQDGPREIRFNFFSRGDRVPGSLFLAPESGRLVLLAISGNDALVSRAGARWSRFASVLRIDLPLCGERSNEKLAALLHDSAHVARPQVYRDLAGQLAADLENALRWSARSINLERTALAYVGVGLGSLLAGPFCARHSRLRSVMLDSSPSIDRRSDPVSFEPLAAPPARALDDWLDEVARRLLQSFQGGSSTGDGRGSE